MSLASAEEDRNHTWFEISIFSKDSKYQQIGKRYCQLNLFALKLIICKKRVTQKQSRRRSRSRVFRYFDIASRCHVNLHHGDNWILDRTGLHCRDRKMPPLTSMIILVRIVGVLACPGSFILRR